MIAACALPSLALAQRGNAYVFFAPGAVTCCGGSEMTIQAGGGGEVQFLKRLGAGLEVSGLGLADSPQNGAGFVSLNGYYHFRPEREKRLDPFVTGGYTALVKMGHVNMGNYGGGLHYWFARHFGLRVEFRDQIRNYRTETLHYWGVRFGVAFR